MKFLFCFKATSPVVPLPKKGSKTIPPENPALQEHSFHSLKVNSSSTKQPEFKIKTKYVKKTFS